MAPTIAVGRHEGLKGVLKFAYIFPRVENRPLFHLCLTNGHHESPSDVDYNGGLKLMLDTRFRVGPWTIEPRSGAFRRDDGTSLTVRAKVMDLLVFFAEHPGEVLTKDALLDGVWGTEAISESALTRTITELRQALGDDAERPTVLETIPKRGYRLIAPVSIVEPVAASRSPSADPTRSTTRHIAVLAVALLLIVSAAIAITWKGRSEASPTGLTFKPRDLVLITRFENKTGHDVFDGAVEYALERELSNSDTVGLVAADRIDDALRLMKKPVDTVIDRQIGREVCQRDGGIKAMVTGRIETFDGRYVITTQLVDPTDGSIVTSVTEQAGAERDILAALSRSASRVREVLGERHHLMRSPAADIQKVSTVSLRALQLYSQSYQLGRQGQWSGALELGRQAVDIDPNFASGWIWVAWSLFRTGAPAAEVRTAAERAVSLTEGAADWEHHWIVGSYRSFIRDDAGAAQSYEALLALRPDHVYGVNSLQTAYTALGRAEEAMASRKRLADLRPNDLYANYMAAADIVRHTRSTDTAQPYIERMRALSSDPPIEEEATPATWLAVLPAYQTWVTGDARAALQHLEQIRLTLPTAPQPGWKTAANYVGDFYLSLGRFDAAERLYEEMDAVGRRAILAEARHDFVAMRKWLLRMENPAAMRVERFVKAGLVEHARRFMRPEHTYRIPNSTPQANTQVMLAQPLGEGYLALYEGRPDLAVAPLQRYIIISKNMWDASPYSACAGLATAFERLGRMRDAIEVLEPCASRRPPYFGVFAGGPWLEVQMQLADVYRKVGRIDDALALERNVRSFLALADEDHPLVVHLRGGETNR